MYLRNILNVVCGVITITITCSCSHSDHDVITTNPFSRADSLQISDATAADSSSVTPSATENRGDDGADEPIAVKFPQDLLHRWNLTGWHTQEGDVSFSGGCYVEFRSDGTVHAKAVNEFFGKYALADGGLTLAPFGGTKIGVGDEHFLFFEEHLPKIYKFAVIRGNILLLYFGEDEYLSFSL